MRPTWRSCGDVCETLYPILTCTLRCAGPPQSVKILTYREPQNKEYQDFVSHLKTDALKNFNFTIDDSLVRPSVRPSVCVCACVCVRL